MNELTRRRRDGADEGRNPVIMHDDDTDLTFGELLAAMRGQARLLVIGPVGVGLLALGVSSLIPPTFTAATSFLPPQHSQGAAASALASLGALGGLAGNVAGVNSPGERYVALMQSVVVSDRLIEQFKLLEAYDVDFRIDGRKELGRNVRISLGKKDGLIKVEVDDTSPQRAADMANQYVEELRRLTATLAVTEAQQRRQFFEKQLQSSRDKLLQSQLSLQASGFNPGALKTEPKAAAEGYARLKAELTSAEVRLQILRGSLADGASEVLQQQSAIAALRGQLAKSEQPTERAEGPDYVSRYREFKYQETLFELYARQFELARVDESREGALVQIVDPATVPEKKSKPRRAVITVIATALAFVILAVGVVMRRQKIAPRA